MSHFVGSDIFARGGRGNGEGYRPDYIHRPVVFWPAYSFEENPSTRFLAAEIEAGTVVNAKEVADDLDTLMKRWHCSQSGDCAFEIKTGPANGDLWPTQIRQFLDLLNRGGVTMNGSCGCHIHVDVRDFTAVDLRKLMKMWYLVEATLFALLPSKRRTNSACGSIHTTLGKVLQDALASSPVEAEAQEWVGGVLLARTWMPANIGKGHESWMRASSLNIASYSYRGSVECRMLEGTMDAERIINWGMLLAGLLDYVKQAPEKEINNLLEIKEDGLELLFRVCYTPTMRRWLVDTYKEHSPSKSKEVCYVAPEPAEVQVTQKVLR